MQLATEKSSKTIKIAVGRNESLYLKPHSTTQNQSGFIPKKQLAAQSKITDETDDKIYRNFSEDFRPFPVKSDRNCFYISGPSGAGKSYLAAEFIAEYKRKYPKNHVFVFQPTTTADPAFESLRAKEDEDDPKFHIIALNELRELLASVGAEDFTAEDFRNSCVLFDDFLCITCKATSKYVAALKKMLLETGRKLKVTVICTSHILANFNETKDMINESNMISFFPGNADRNTIGFLKGYIGLDAEQLKTIINLPKTSAARWVMIGTWPVRYVLWAHGAYIL